jgi:mannose-6-phosphate isomerase-like protein (cupin superfamily)
MDRREFAASLPALLAAGTLLPTQLSAQTAPSKPVKELTGGTFHPGPVKEGAPGRASRAYLSGMLKAGNIRLEMHETMQKPGAVHEPIGSHLHNEIWCVQRGVASLYIDGTEHRMDAGDVGLVCAGQQHWIKNAGDTELAYFVITVGPPE